MKRLIVALIAALSLIVPLSSPLAAEANAPLANTGELLVKLGPGDNLSDDAGATGPHAAGINHALRAEGAYQATAVDDSTYLVRFDSQTHAGSVAARLAAEPGVVYAEPNYVRSLLRTSNDPLLGQQWSISNIHAPEAWDITTGGEIVVALLDTGISPTHPDLQGRAIPGYDFFNNDDDPRDDEGHGTHIAGIVAANGDNGEGVAGVCWNCKILPIKVLGSRGRGSDAMIAAGIRYAVDNGARIIGMSLGGPEESRTLREAVTYALDRNVLIVAASGNDNARGNLPSYPAAYPGVLAVSATGRNDALASFSTTGDFIDIAAPGVDILSTFYSRSGGDTYASASGTSAAAPYVAGAAALLMSLRPDISSAQVAELLQAGADDVDVPGKDPNTGFGRLHVARSLQLATAPDALSRSSIQGAVVGAPFDQVTISLNTGQQTRPDANGFYRFDNLPTGSYTIVAALPDGTANTQQVYVSGTPISIATINFAFGVAGAGSFQPVPAPADSSIAYFPETGHTLRGAFREYWSANGGLPVFGFPISEEFTERGEDGRDYLVQYFERNRFEFHPENAPPYNVLLGRLGDTILRQSGRDWFTFPKGVLQSDCLFFEATGHSLCGQFLRYWQANGLELDGRRGKSQQESLALLGQPISEPQLETFPDGRTYVVQWFERARFEDHGSEGVLLGLLGNELAAAQGLRR
jgi:type VII secretion-associated serine protease mycosin